MPTLNFHLPEETQRRVLMMDDPPRLSDGTEMPTSILASRLISWFIDLPPGSRAAVARKIEGKA